MSTSTARAREIVAACVDVDPLPWRLEVEFHPEVPDLPVSVVVRAANGDCVYHHALGAFTPERRRVIIANCRHMCGERLEAEPVRTSRPQTELRL